MPPGKNKDKRKNKRKRSGGEAYFARPLNRKQAKAQVRRAARIATRPERRQIKAEKRASKLQQERIAEWFPQYGEAIGESAQRSQAATDRAVAQIQQTTGASAEYAERLRKELAAESQAEAATRGAPPSPLADELAQASAAARRTSGDTLAGVTASQGAAQTGYLWDKKRIGKREEIEQQLRESARGRSYDQDLRSLSRDQRDIMRDEFSRLRDSERDYELAQQAASGETASQKTQLRLARRYGKNKKREQRRSFENQSAITDQQDRNERADDARARRYARRFGGPGKGGDEGPDNSRSVGPGKIKSYIADNASPDEVASDPQVAVRKVLNRWPYLNRRYVLKIVRSYAGGRADPRPGGPGNPGGL